jgi:ferric-dicitrate binding protein FerR (iron transport regulator)
MTDELLFKYISGQTDENETHEVREWSASSEHRKRELAHLKNIWILTGLDLEVDDQIKEKEIRIIMDQIHELNKKDRAKQIRIVWLRYAAIALLLIGLSGTAGYFLSNSSKNNFTSETGFTEIVTPKGERSNVVLSDGSSVNLNAGSVLKFVPSLNSQKREVTLQGEAFFKVKHDASRPFIVKTGNLKIKVLGTSFNVSNYLEDSSITTFLEEGKVQVYFKDEHIVLNPREALKYNKTTGKSSKLTVTDDRFSDWTRGILTVNDETIEEVAKKLERKFDVQVIFGDEEVKNHMYAGSIKDNDINMVLEALEFASSLKYKRDGDVVFLYSK